MQTAGVSRCGAMRPAGPPRPLQHAGSGLAVTTAAPRMSPARLPSTAVSANNGRDGNEVGWLTSYANTDAEDARRQASFRAVYDFDRWKKHRSNLRLFDRLLLVGKSSVLRNITPSVVWVGYLAVSVSAYMAAFDNHMLPGWAPSLELNNSATTFLTYTSAFLSLLLVFRTNASYGRWDEARKMWGLLLNRSRDIMRMGATMIPNDEPETKRALARWTIAVAAALRLHFQPGEATLKEMTGDWLSDKELRALEDAPHKPVMAIHALSQVVMNSKMDSIEKTTLGTNITQYHDILGGCERLLRAPIPVSYTRHTARFLFLWLSFLPFAAYHNLHEFTAPVTMLIAACLLAVEEIGVQCEEPFGVLPLIVIVERVKADVSKTLQDDVDVQKIVMEAMMADKMALAQAGRDPSTLTTRDVPLSAANMVSAKAN